MKRFLTFLGLISIVLSSHAVEPRSYEFAVIGNDTLRMDVYMPDDTCAAHPAVLFAFGGGFTHGKRNDSHYTEYFNTLADNGIVAISTDYRTTLAKDPQKLTSADGFAQALTGAISDAVSDFYTATCYILQNAEQIRVDTGKIIASGSSAGAITALQAEYGLRNGQAAGIFPQEFNYAGVISFAGAIFSSGSMYWQNKSCPMLLFHGDADRNVPYDRLSAGPVSLCGSATIARSLASKAVPCEFYSFAGADHVIATSPMTDNLYDILGFVKRVAEGKETLTINAVVTKPGATVNTAPVFSIEDYIKANM